MAVLHQTMSKPALVPAYVPLFHCIGAECEDNCCTGWSVSIDKKTFHAYRDSEHPKLKEKLRTTITRNRKQASDSNYAKVAMNPRNGQCPFMEEQLCAIQRELGEGALSNTCNNFPRKTRTVPGGVEQALALSCPQAARLALLNPQAFEFQEQTLQVRASSLSTSRLHKQLDDDQVLQVRNFALQLLLLPELELWQKLAVLGIFSEQLTALLQAGQSAEVGTLLHSMEQLLQSGQVAQALAPMVPDHTIQAHVFAQLWQLKSGLRFSARQNVLQLRVATGLRAPVPGCNDHVQTVTENYRQGLLNLDKVLATTPMFLENYLLNEVFTEMFPLGDRDPFSHYLKLVSRYGVVRLMLAALCANAQALPTPRDMASAVQVFCRQYQHDRSFSGHVNESLSKAGLARLETLYRFLRTQ